MEYTIFHRGREVGTLRLSTEGLYYRLSAQCADLGHGVWRLWGCFGQESRPVGVFFPGTGGLRLERRVSRHSWPLLPDCFTAGREERGFRPWRGILEGQELPDAMLRQNEDGSRSLAIFAPPQGPVPFAERVPQMEEERLDGRACLVLGDLEAWSLGEASEAAPTDEEETGKEETAEERADGGSA